MRPFTYHYFLKKQELLTATTTLLLLLSEKESHKWRLVQDIWLINKPVIPFHPVIPNPYTLLAQRSLEAQYSSILDLKDTFFCIPLNPDSQPLFSVLSVSKPPTGVATSTDSLEASPGNKLDSPLERPNISNIKLSHPTP
jgi:hypothetical protein